MGKLICRICANGDNNELYVAREMVFGFRDEFDYFRCSSCGCLQIREIPGNLDKYYPPGYYSFDLPRQRGLNPVTDILKRKRTSHHLGQWSMLGMLLARIAGAPDLPDWLLGRGLRVDHRILDVGSGSGALLVGMRHQGFFRLHGIDPFISSDLRPEAGVLIRKGTLEDIDGQFDLIMLHHSFEHMSDPYRTFRLLSRKLADDGLLLIRTPTVSSRAWEIYRTDWFQLDAPRHFFLHSIGSIELLAGKHGFRIEEIRYDSDAKQFWASEQYRRDIHYLAENSYRNDPQGSIFDQATILEYEARAEILNEARSGDQACFFLKKSRR